jgi:hypothetical protein
LPAFPYEEGRGVLQDYVPAHMWINLSSADLRTYPPEKVATALKAIEMKMTAQQMAEAQRPAREWKPAKEK